jgi:ribosomal protein S18 acetylase RimI-like enzyme
VTAAIRQATASDAESIGTLAAEFQSYLRPLGDQADFNWDARKYLRDGFGESPAFEGLVAEVGSAVVAFALYHSGYDTDRGQRMVYLIDLYVSPAFRRCGIGRRLMQRVSGIGRTRGAELIAWSVSKRNTMALSFYETLGPSRVEDLQVMWVPIDK